jgi:hypothetical protein
MTSWILFRGTVTWITAVCCASVFVIFGASSIFEIQLHPGGRFQFFPRASRIPPDFEQDDAALDLAGERRIPDAGD